MDRSQSSDFPMSALDLVKQRPLAALQLDAEVVLADLEVGAL